MYSLKRKIIFPLCVLSVCFFVGPVDAQLLTGQSEASEKVTLPGQKIIWAVNIGGGDYLGIDDIAYQADDLAVSATKGRIDSVSGSQTEKIYKTYRMGNLAIKRRVDNGVYDLTFKFAEPLDIGVGGRVFNILVEGQREVARLDVRAARDGRHLSALDLTVPGVEVSDGQLDITFEPLTAQPLLNALVVRTKGEPKNWRLVWRDEFNYHGPPDAEKWTIDEWPARKVNDEDQTYTPRSKNIRVTDGALILEAHKEDYRNATYTSGRIHSSGKGDFLYGRVEARVKLPAGQGIWPAVWMLPSDPFKYATTCSGDED